MLNLSYVAYQNGDYIDARTALVFAIICTILTILKLTI